MKKEEEEKETLKFAVVHHCSRLAFLSLNIYVSEKKVFIIAMKRVLTSQLLFSA